MPIELRDILADRDPYIPSGIAIFRPVSTKPFLPAAMIFVSSE